MPNFLQHAEELFPYTQAMRRDFHKHPELGFNEIRTGGIRFPKSIITSGKDAAGKPQTVTLTFDKVTLNESFPASTFAVPGMGSR